MSKKPFVYKEELSVGEVASRSGVAVSTLHFYESKGLISSQRNNGNHRRYHRGVLRKIAVIKVAQRAGIPLKEIKEALSTLSNDRTVTAKDWARLADNWRDDLNDRIARLTRMRDTIGYCIGCGCLSVDDCYLMNPADELGEKGPGAHLLDPDVEIDTKLFEHKP